MKLLSKMMVGAVALSAATAMAAPQFPFPQNKKSPYGQTALYADTDIIKSHFDLWKGAWYSDKGDYAWVLAPEGTESTVSEGIAYGMLIMVYMSSTTDDHQSEFDKLWQTWQNNAVTTGGGMNWRVGASAGNGTATDADVDAALALVMAYKQWGDEKYLTAAKTLISWIGNNEINSGHVKPGNQWNDAFNPSYGTLANFELFKSIDASGPWSTVLTTAASDLSKCQNSSTGLVPDWCDWNSYQPTLTSAAVSNDMGFYDDAARTPWRMAWAYYWYGNSNAKKFNDKIVNWLYDATNMTASGINSGYSVDGTADNSVTRNFVSSSFSGGLGLAAASADSPEPYLETVYKVLSSLTSCATASGCGDNVAGEKYYPSTLNLLYMLLMTGNMPNFYDMTGFESFTPDPSLARSVSMPAGVQQVKGDSTVGISGFWNWGAYHDKYASTGTVMAPDSGDSPLFYRNGAYYAEASMEIGAEPEWTQAAADAGTLQYPSAGIAMSFLASEKGVNFVTLGVKYLRVTMKAEGPIRMAILNDKTAEAGGEPGIYVPNSTDYQTITYNLTKYDYGFIGLQDQGGEYIDILSWVDRTLAPLGEEILTAVSGLKWEVKDSKGGYGAISVKEIQFLDANKQVIDPSKITGVAIESATSSSSAVVGISSSSTAVDPTSSSDVYPTSSSTIDPGVGIAAVEYVSFAKVMTSGKDVQIVGAKTGSDYAVFSLQGKVISSGKVMGAAQNVAVPNKGMYLVRVEGKMHKVTVK